MALLRQVGLFGEDTKGAIIRRAYTAGDLRQAYCLVHDVFLGTGYMEPEPAGIRLRMFETLSETATFIAEKNGTVVGVLSVVGDSPGLGLPSDGAFKRELDELRAAGLRLCEFTNQAVAENYRKSAVPTELMRCAIAHGMRAGYSHSIATVSPGHHGFYDLVGFHQFGPERSYSHKYDDPVVAMSLDLDCYRQPIAGLSETANFLQHFGGVDNHFMGHVSDWARHARRHFLNADLLRQLFVADRDFLAECSSAELQILEERWGRETFHAVFAESDAATVEVSDSVDHLFPTFSIGQMQWESFTRPGLDVVPAFS